MKIAVELPGTFADAGDYLADARALDAAGADTLWVSPGGLDPWMVLASLATVTGRARLAVPVAPEGGDVLLRRVETLHRLSRGRVLSVVDGSDEAELLIARAREVAPCPVFLCASRDGHPIVAARLADGLVTTAGPSDSQAAFDLARRRRERDGRDGPFELWTRTEAPQGREHWRGALDAARTAGATGVIVPVNPRLLDLLRNPEAENDRSDLLLAQG